MNKPLVIDCTIFSGELELLELRLNHLKNSVDFWVIVEAGHTQTRLPKPYYFEENKDKYSEFLDRIIYIKLDNVIPGPEGSWRMEWFTRESILDGLVELQKQKNIVLKFNDIILISDLDEICGPKQIEKALEKQLSLCSFDHTFIAYYMNLYSDWRHWYGTIFCWYELLDSGIQKLRQEKDGMLHIENLGDSYHFSSLGGFDRYWEKLKNCIEPYDKSFLLDENKEMYRAQFQKHVIEDKYFWFVDNWRNLSIKLDILPENMLPSYVVQNKSKFQHLLLPS